MGRVILASDAGDTDGAPSASVITTPLNLPYDSPDQEETDKAAGENVDDQGQTRDDPNQPANKEEAYSKETGYGQQLHGRPCAFSRFPHAFHARDS